MSKHWIADPSHSFSARAPPSSVLSVDFEHVGSDYTKDTTFEAGFFFISSDGTSFKKRLHKRPDTPMQYEADPDNITWLSKLPDAWTGYLLARDHGLAREAFVTEVRDTIAQAVELAGGARNLLVIADMHADLARLAHILGRSIDCILGERNPPLCTTDFFRGALGAWLGPNDAESAALETTKTDAVSHTHMANDDAERTARAFMAVVKERTGRAFVVVAKDRTPK